MRSVLGPLSIVCVTLCSFSAAQADDQAECKPILEKAIKAMGGAAKLDKLTIGTWKAKTTGKDNGAGVEIALLSEGTWQGRDQIRLDAEVQVGGKSEKAVLVINGEKGWIKGGDKTDDAPKEIMLFIKNFAYAMRMPQLLTQLQGKEFQLSSLGEIKIDNVEAVGLKVAHKDYKDVSVFFDKKEGVPIKAEITVTDPHSKELTVECLFGDYKDFEGVKLPGKITLHVDGKEFVIELSEIKASEKLDDSVFGKP
jgi:hypothetical protein